jgi:hypothetical protein
MKANDMTDCPTPEDILAMLRCELDLSREEQVRNHCESCPPCKELSLELSSTLDMLHHDEDTVVAKDLAPEILSSIEENRRRSYTFPVTLSTIARAAACFVLIALAGLTIRHLSLQRSSAPDLATNDTAARQGMEWLVSIQEDSGKWDPDRWGGRREYTVGLTGMALLSLVRNSESFAEKAASIERSVAFLLKQQREDGRLGDDFDGTMYNHGIAAVALMETYAANKDAIDEVPLRKMLDYVREQQLATGGWGYRNRLDEEANTSISCWPLQALLISAELGWEDDNIALRKGLRWMASVVDESGLFGYEQVNQFPRGPNALTAMGAYCLFRADKGGMVVDERVLAHVRSAVNQLSEKTSDGDFYRTYFHVGALKELGDDSEERARFDGLHDRLLASRQTEGPNTGTWDPKDQWGSVGGRIYSTAMATLSLCPEI